MGKIKMKSTDESGIERIFRGNITEISKPLLSAAEGLQRMELSSLRRWRNLVGTKHSRCFWKFEQFWPSTKSRVVVGTASDSAAKATCTMRMCELAMPHLSLHWSNQPRTAGPGWKLTMDNVTSRMNLRINLGSSGECWPLVSPPSWRGRHNLKRIMLCSHLGARCVCV